MMTAAEPGRKLYRGVVVSLGLLCILQAALNISLRLALYHSDSTSYNTLKRNLSDCDNKTLDLEANFKTLTEERDELKKKLTDFDKKVLDLEASFKTLTEERDELKKNLTDFVHDQQGWAYFNGSFYYISSNKKTWNESRTDCLQKGMDLMVVNSKEEQEFINRYQTRMWIGLTDSEREGTWKWVDGTPLTTSFWLSGEPNDNEGRNEDCVETKFYNDEETIFYGGENSWNDAICGNRNSWICEKKMFL